jgi:hypothetical protein
MSKKPSQQCLDWCFTKQLSSSLAKVTCNIQQIPMNMAGCTCLGTVLKYHRLGDLNSRNLFSHGSGGLKSKLKVTAGLVSPTPLSLACRWLPSLSVLMSMCLCPHLFLQGHWSHWVRARAHDLTLTSLPIKDPNHE